MSDRADKVALHEEVKLLTARLGAIRLSDADEYMRARWRIIWRQREECYRRLRSFP